jgi:hypothetical protein
MKEEKKSTFVLDTTPQAYSPKEIIKEFHLDHAQLAFTIGKKTFLDNATILMTVFSTTTIFSDDMVELNTRESNMIPIEKLYLSNSSSSNSQVYKYMPKIGSTRGNDDVIIVFTNRLKPSGKIILSVLNQ